MNETVQPTLLLVDDEPANLQVLRHILQDQYQLKFARDGEKAIAIATNDLPDLILLDVMMPGMTGLEVCKTLKSNLRTAHIPIIFVTALTDTANEAQGFESGAVDYITKPVSPPIVQARVKNHLSLVHIETLKETRLQIIQRLGRAAEFKDNETGMHVIRMSYFAKELALAAGCSQQYADELLDAAPMHDIGKIGIPDAILQKPGKLDPTEWQIMQTHVDIGATILGDDTSSLLQTASTIAKYHHERWDGNGYPHQLKGEDIPLSARIVAIADVFDALTSVRPYKGAWTVDEALSHIQTEAGKHFDPALVSLFIELKPKLIAIRAKWAD
ncbi:two-component system response regulator [Leeia sp. TBRC 13508]|uniref:Two-component system response regulator n=1 Tax=Leeia speluncae TaxID=2884804 RepID=A0ABS8D428_9NEIS|nr:two-component system response regulator [Leeia speluncae]MCB6182947.1 two-component system response regulator [Leeia speluncae]